MDRGAATLLEIHLQGIIQPTEGAALEHGKQTMITGNKWQSAKTHCPRPHAYTPAAPLQTAALRAAWDDHMTDEIRLSPSWRIIVVPAARIDRRTWSVQRLVDGAWQDAHVTRSREMLRWYLPLCGTIDKAVRAIVANLPDRIDRRRPGEPGRSQYIRKRAPKVVAAPIAEVMVAEPAAPIALASLDVGYRPPGTPAASNLLAGPRGAAQAKPPGKSRACAWCGLTFTFSARSPRTLSCSPVCVRAYRRRYLQELRARDPGWPERARLDEAARRAARKARKQAREIALAAAAEQPIEPATLEHFHIFHGVRIDRIELAPASGPAVEVMPVEPEASPAPAVAHLEAAPSTPYRDVPRETKRLARQFLAWCRDHEREVERAMSRSRFASAPADADAW
ncbi:hypothetical protein [Bradyrhizobium genosp. P]|uniref:hypothetical protein n=1 Tax=Bradyrhizobium genosp. P TaxID=83641 RepID=UPI003CE6BC8C